MIKPSTASKEHLPVIKKASGKYVCDVEGNKCLDFTGANLTVILGHNQFKFKNSPNFPGKSFLEDEVSNLLSKHTKTKHFRYFKNGSDAVNCAIRLARHLLTEDKWLVNFMGYAGSNDCYAHTVNKNGIPYQLSRQIPVLSANNVSTRMSQDIILGSYARDKYGIIVFESRYSGFGKQLKSKIKICDHLKSGINGLWEKIDADFHLYGKSLANGYPVAVLTGHDDYMKRIDEIYYSTTFGGDNVGLEAIKKTLKEYDRKKWLELKEYADSVLPPWQSLKPEQIKKFTKQGVLFTGYWQIMTSHTKEDIDRLASLCKKIL